MDKILIGRWDCDSCGTIGVMGDLYSCNNCGAARPDNVRFYLPENSPIETDAKKIAEANAGPDWKCEYCGSWISAALDDCNRCGGGEEAASEKQKTTIYDNSQDIPRSSKEAIKPRKKKSLWGRLDKWDDKKVRTTPNIFNKWSVPTFIGTILLLLGLGGYFLFKSSYIEVEVTDHSWKRTQHIEQYQTLSKSDWNHPSDAFNIRTESKIHHYNKVLDHYETRYRTEYYRVQEGTQTERYTERVACGTERYISGYRTVNLGNGRFRREPRYSTRTKYRTVTRTRQVPRYVQKSKQVPYQEAIYKQVPEYRTYYYYKVNRWQRITPRMTTGIGTGPHWPSTKLDAYDTLEPGAKRLGKREEIYTICLRNTDPENKKDYSCNLDFSRWKSLEFGQKLVAKIRLGKVEELLTLEEYQAKQ
jgi:hypothetical protein